VDKVEFVHSVNGLPQRKHAGKALYRCGTKVGQKTLGWQKRPFCTLVPVDMQAFFHRRSVFSCFWAYSSWFAQVCGQKKDQRAGSMQSSAVWQGVVSSAACAGGAVGQPYFL